MYNKSDCEAYGCDLMLLMDFSGEKSSKEFKTDKLYQGRSGSWYATKAEMRAAFDDPLQMGTDVYIGVSGKRYGSLAEMKDAGDDRKPNFNEQDLTTKPFDKLNPLPQTELFEKKDLLNPIPQPISKDSDVHPLPTNRVQPTK